MAIVASGLQIAFWSIIIPSVIGIAMKLFSSFFYAIGKLLFWVIDLLQTVFRKLAGLDTIWMNGEQTDGDILLSIFRSQVVVDTLISVTVFAVALVIVATIVQMVRTEYTTEGSKNSKEGILGQALKSLVMFILIPVVCFFGIRVSNYLLQAVDYATSSGGSQSISGAIFNASTIDANKVVNKTDGEHEFSDLTIGGIMDWILPNTNGAKGVKYENGAIMKFEETLKSNQSDDTKARQEIGKKIDQLMAMNKSSAKKFGSAGYGEGVNPTGEIYYGNIAAVRYFYDMGEINFLILYVGAFLVLQALFNASMGLVVRMYKATALFVIAPAAIGLQPLDGGNAYKSWKKSFLSTVLAAYGVIVALNIFFVVAGVVSQIELWDPKGSFLNYGLNKFMQALFIVVGATQIKGLAKTMGDLIGGADAMSEGASATGDATKLVGSVAKVGVGAAVAGKAIGHGVAGQLQKARLAVNQRNMGAEERTRAKWDKKMGGASYSASTGWIDKDGKAIKDKNRLKELDEMQTTRLQEIGKARGVSARAASWNNEKGDKLRAKSNLNIAKSGQSFNAVAGMIGDSAPVKTLMGLTGGSVFKSAASGKMFKEYDEEYAKTGIPQAAGLKSGTKLASGVKKVSEFITDPFDYKAKEIESNNAITNTRKSITDTHTRTQRIMADTQNANFQAQNKLLGSTIADSYTDKDMAQNASGLMTMGSDVRNSKGELDTSKISAQATKMYNGIKGDFVGMPEMDGLRDALKDLINRANLGYKDHMESDIDAVRQQFMTAYGSKENQQAFGTLNAKNANIENAKTQEDNVYKAAMNTPGGGKDNIEAYTQAMKNALSTTLIKMDDDETQETIRQMLSEGVIKTKEEGEKMLKLDYVRINQAIKDAIAAEKNADKAASESKAAKEQAKLLQDILKELKKKK